jgi:hypothetical protein
VSVQVLADVDEAYEKAKVAKDIRDESAAEQLKEMEAKQALHQPGSKRPREDDDAESSGNKRQKADNDKEATIDLDGDVMVLE